MRRNLRKMAEAEFENFGGASALGGPRGVKGLDTLLQMVSRRWQSRPEQRRAPPPPRIRGIENNLYWMMDVTFDEDRCRTRKDASQNSEPSCWPLNDFGLCPAHPPGTFVPALPIG